MSDAATLRLARAAGLAVRWTGQNNMRRTVETGVLRGVLGALGLPAASSAQCRDSMAELTRRNERKLLVTAEAGLPCELPGRPERWRIIREDGAELTGDGAPPATLPLGYHRVESEEWNGTLAVTPRRAWSLREAGDGRRLAGLAAQLYSLRRGEDGGCGDFAALAELAAKAAAKGLDAVAISPVHALFTADPGRAAPYAPSSRMALNPVYAGVNLPGIKDDLIDWPTVAAARLAALRQDYLNDAAKSGFDEFRRIAPPEIHWHALFETIAAAEGTTDWRRWPPDLASPAATAVRTTARAAADEINFHLYLQFRAARDLAAAQRTAKQNGMRIGLITDLAAGADPGGSDAWMRPEEMLRGLTIGAPPDLFNKEGQSWGLVTFSPFGHLDAGFSGWIGMLRAALAHAGGVRIDHAMGMARLWVIPDGASAQDGVYLAYPSQDLIRLAALESRRHHAVILAEDLGTVPAGFQDRLAAAGIAGLRVLWFERRARGFRPPEKWSQEAAAMTSTHDLPTVAGWWKGRDLAWRRHLGMQHETSAARERARHLLWHGFQRAGLAEGPPPAQSAPVADAAAAFIGHSASKLALLPLEDALALEEQPNLPGTVYEHPNWRRRLPVEVGTMLERPDVAARLGAMQTGRGS